MTSSRRGLKRGGTGPESGGFAGLRFTAWLYTNQEVANVIIGIVGSSLGFWIAGQMGLGASSEIGAYAIAVAGAAVLIGLLKVLGVLK